LGARNITLSTCGLVDKIYMLAELKLQITLSVSLHAPNDEIRRTIMPIAKRYPINKLIEACRHYANHTKRRITFEYALIDDINDSIEHAVELAKLTKGIMCHVNLLKINAGRGYNPPSMSKINSFKNKLAESKVNVSYRESKGADIKAACGQLRKKDADLEVKC
jgi:23S rRNA (adenine2503-C2)-methyltransferase